MSISRFTLKIVAGLLLFCLQANAQISTREEPASFRKNIPTLRASEQAKKRMASFDLERVRQEDKENEMYGMPPRFGYIHNVSLNLENSGEWTVLPCGGKLWRLVISSPGALSINLLYDKFWLPYGAKFWIYSNEHRHSIGAFTSTNNNGSRDDIQGFATGLVPGDQVTLEYYLPSDASEVGVISISGVVHGYRFIMPQHGFVPVPGIGFNQSGDCQVNINCPEGDDWQNEKRAVALILADGIRWCTGFLVNNTANDFTPYFMTADHCLRDVVNDRMYDAVSRPLLNHWIFYWNYELPPNPNDCNFRNSTPSEPLAFSTQGARVVANLFITDFALLRLNENPMHFHNQTPSFTPYYLGWDRSGNPGTGGVGIHHPRGDVKKIATYNITPISSHYSYWVVNWASTPNGHSVNEFGSSGSPLINSNRRVIGQLYTVCLDYCDGVPNPRCSNPANVFGYFGKFCLSWIGSGITTSRYRRLDYWLDPLGINPETLDGTTCVSYFINETVSANKTIFACKDFEIGNITITNNAILTIAALGEVIFVGDVEIISGDLVIE